MAQFSGMQAPCKGVVMQPSRLVEFTRRDGTKDQRFETDVVQATKDGTSVVTVQSDHPVFERVDTPQPFEAEVSISVARGERGTFVFVTLAANGAAPKPKG